MLIVARFMFFLGLLLAYMNGASNLSRALIKAGAHAGIQNRQGMTIFNAQVATKMLLYRLLGTTRNCSDTM